MKAIRISDEAYKFLNKIAIDEKRSLIATLDLFVKIFKEGLEYAKSNGLEKNCLPPTTKTKS